MMKFNLANPQAGTQKSMEVDDIAKQRIFFEKSLGQEVQVDALGPEFKGYVFKITGGNDRDGFPMKQGVKTRTRVRLLLKAGQSCYRPKRTGERKRKSVRGCIVAEDIKVLSLTLVKKGEAEIPGLTDTIKAKRLGPKRASKIRKLFGFKKEDPKELIKKHVIRRTFKTAAGKERVKAPKIQRLITEIRIKRKADLKKIKKEKGEASKRAAKNYHDLLEEFRKASKHHEEVKEAKKEVKKEAPKKETKEAPKVSPAPAKKDAKQDSKQAPAPAKVQPKKDQKPQQQTKPPQKK